MNDTFLISVGSGIALSLIAGLKIVWDRLNAKDKEHSEERKEWFKRLEEMMDRQNSTVRKVGEDHDKTLEDITNKYDKRQGEINDTFLEAFKKAFGSGK